MLQPANFSISRLSSTNGNPRSSASICPSADLPAPRRPISATRVLHSGVAAPVPSTSPMATRTWRNLASSRFSSSSRISSHSGLEVVTSPSNSINEHCKALATCNSTRMEALPSPYSRLAKCRSETSAAAATARRVMPRRARKPRTRSPSCTRKGFFSATGGALSTKRPSSCGNT